MSKFSQELSVGHFQGETDPTLVGLNQLGHLVLVPDNLGLIT